MINKIEAPRLNPTILGITPYEFGQMHYLQLLTFYPKITPYVALQRALAQVELTYGRENVPQDLIEPKTV